MSGIVHDIGAITQTLQPIAQVLAGTFAVADAVIGTITQALQPITQVLTGTFAPGTSTATITQTLPFITQSMSGIVHDIGTITQTLPAITQSGTATYDPKDVTSVAIQTLSSITQSMSGIVHDIGTITQTLQPIAQVLTGTFAPGVSTAAIIQTLPAITQSGTATFVPGTKTGSITQTLPSINQILVGDNVGLFPILDHPGIVWEQPAELLIWQVGDEVSGTPQETRTYYLDASISGPSDPGSVWTDDPNGFDGSVATYAWSTGETIPASNTTLHGAGHSGGLVILDNAITSVRGRTYTGTDAGGWSSILLRHPDTFDDIDFFGTNTNALLSPDWSAWRLLDVPVGGWTWDILNRMQTHWYSNILAEKRVYRAEIEVIISARLAVSNFIYQPEEEELIYERDI